MQAAEDDSVAFAEHQHAAREPAGNADSDPVGDAEHDAHADAVEHPDHYALVRGKGVRDGSHGTAEPANAEHDANTQPGDFSACPAVATGEHHNTAGEGAQRQCRADTDSVGAAGTAAVTDGDRVDQSSRGLIVHVHPRLGAL